MKQKNKNIIGIIILCISFIFVIFSSPTIYEMYMNGESNKNIHDPNLNDCVKHQVLLKTDIGPPITRINIAPLITKEEFKKIKQDCKQDW